MKNNNSEQITEDSFIAISASAETERRKFYHLVHQITFDAHEYTGRKSFALAQKMVEQSRGIELNDESINQLVASFPVEWRYEKPIIEIIKKWLLNLKPSKGIDVNKDGEVAVAFAKWIAGKSNTNEASNESFAFTLIDGEYYWTDDKDGDQPISEKNLFEMFIKEKIVTPKP